MRTLRGLARTGAMAHSGDPKVPREHSVVTCLTLGHHRRRQGKTNQMIRQFATKSLTEASTYHMIHRVGGRPQMLNCQVISSWHHLSAYLQASQARLILEV